MRAIGLTQFARRSALMLSCMAVVVPLDRAAAQVNTSLIKLAYRCGNWFRIRSSNTVDVTVNYAVYRTGENGSITLPATPTGSPYSETWLQTNNRGSVTLSYNGTRIAERPNGNAGCATPASIGQWTDTIPWPTMAIISALLPNGKVFTSGREYANKQSPPYVIPPGRFNGKPDIWDPALGTSLSAHSFADNLPGGTHTDLFCAEALFLSDGRLLLVGGADSANEDLGEPYINIFNYASNSWTAGPTMADGRWYPGLTMLPNGNVFIMSGVDITQSADSIPELYNPTTNSLTELTGFPKKTTPFNYWAWVFSAPSGQVFYAGDQNFTYYINTSGSGSGGQSFYTADGDYRNYGSPVMYDAGKILIVGGGHTYNTAETIDLNQATPQWQPTGSMAAQRRQMNAVILANGLVMASGGSAGPDAVPATNISYTPEAWNPKTGVWTQWANYRIPRLYHSETLLLPDARVLSVGGGQPAATGLPDNFNGEIFSPPYLFNPDGSSVSTSRPIITSAPSSVGYGGSMQFTVQNVAAGTASVLWIKLGAVTHAINANQRLNHLTSSQSGQTLTVNAPMNANAATPGHYLLFVLNANGVPSVGKIIQIQ